MHTRLCLAILAVLLLFTSEPVSAGTEEPVVSAQANAPGWITVRWDHSGVDVFWYELHRRDRPDFVPRVYGASGTYTDTNLQPATLYSYKICAIYDYNQACSGWKSATTLQPEPPPPSATNPAAPAQRQPTLVAPEIRATTNHPLAIWLHWGDAQAWLLKNAQLYRNNQVVYDGRSYGDFIPSYQDHSLRANTEYTYKICFIGFNDDTKCSNEIKATAQPITPTAPESLSIVTQRITYRNSSRTTTTLNLESTVYAHVAWENSAIPGQFITVERQDTSSLGRGGLQTTAQVTNLTPYWREIERISSLGDPTSILFDVNVPATTGSVKGTTYRVCAVVPQLGEAGVACSAAVPLR